MENTLMALLYEYHEVLPAMLFVGFGGFGFLARRWEKKRREVLVARTTESARQQGMGYAPPTGHDTNGGVIQGTHRFGGTTRGVAWTAEVTLLTSEVDGGLATRSNGSVCYTRWNAPGAGAG